MIRPYGEVLEGLVRVENLDHIRPIAYAREIHSNGIAHDEVILQHSACAEDFVSYVCTRNSYGEDVVIGHIYYADEAFIFRPFFYSTGTRRAFKRSDVDGIIKALPFHFKNRFNNFCYYVFPQQQRGKVKELATLCKVIHNLTKRLDGDLALTRRNVNKGLDTMLIDLGAITTEIEKLSSVVSDIKRR